uniref:Uncharacterized protein n=1 Tax=Anguilla anguilla TaxID=7936 RepID=A0A0E9UIE6_ANGAN
MCVAGLVKRHCRQIAKRESNLPRSWFPKRYSLHLVQNN